MSGKQKKGLVAFVAVIVVAIAAVGAYSYWTTAGSGSGSATAQAGDANLQVTATGWANLAPGLTKPVNVTVTNPNAYHAYVTAVALDTSVYPNGVSASGSCDPTWFTVTGSPLAVGQDLAGGADTGSLSFGDITFDNSTTVNQNSCKNASITIHFTSS